MKVRLLCFCVVLFNSLCSVCAAQENTAGVPAVTHATTVKASWYKDGFSTTFCGQHFNPNDATIVAHNKLPCGTVLGVTGPSGRYLRMVVQDKGPHVKGRFLDVARAAAEKLGFIKEGVADLKVEILKDP